MKQFQVELKDIERVEAGYRVIGRCVGDTPILLGDFLNDLEVVKIEAYQKELSELSPGLTAGLTLSFRFHAERGDRSEAMYLTLSEYQFDRTWKKPHDR